MKLFLSLIIFVVTGCSHKQYDMAACVRNVFINDDSLRKTGVKVFEEWRKCIIDKPIPNFTLKSISGEVIKTSQLKGKVVVVNFWFVGCAPCIAEMPGLNKLVHEYKSNEVEFLAISPEPTNYIKHNFLAKHKLDFIIIPESKSIIDQIMASGYPTTYFIDKNGIIKEAFNGGEINETAGDTFFNRSKPIVDKLLVQ